MVPSTTFPKRGGFTLVEVVGAITISSIVIGSALGALQLFTLSGARLQRTETARSQTSVAMHRLRSELLLATEVLGAAPTSIGFLIPDTNNDGFPEKISYNWSGIAGDPLTRQVGGGTQDVVMARVGAFSLAYDVEVVTTDTKTESAETLLFSEDTATGLIDYVIFKKNWVGQYFVPALPADAVSWGVTRINVMAQVHGAAKGETAVQLWSPSVANLPSKLLAQTSMMEASLLATYSWQPFAFAGVADLPPDQGMVLVLEYVSDAHSGDVQLHSASGANPTAALLQTSKSGVPWVVDGTQAMSLYVYGTYMTSSAVKTQGALKAVYVTLEMLEDGPVAAVRLDSAAPCLNRPSMGGFALGAVPLTKTP